ncbi:MAG: DUF4270 family protein [Alistipes sp.]|nr:DUF4270 family protein [Alistipes sp.]
MRNYSNRLFRTIYILSLSVVALALSGCSMTADSTLGANMMPEEQIMVMKHLKFKGNKIIRINPDGKNEEFDASLEGKNFLETRLYRTDSLLASNVGYGYLGVRRSDTLGLCSAGFASTMLYMNAIDEEKGFGYMPIFDTMHIVMTIKDYGGDTLVPIRYKVYELLKPLAENALHYDEKRKDTVAYINCDLSGMYDETKPIFEFTFPKSELSQGPSTVVVPMENTQYSWDYVRRLMLIPDNYADAGSEWDGYGRSDVEVYKDDKKWIERFHGLYIKPDLEGTPKNRRGAMYALDLSASGVMLQGRSRNPKDPSMIQDTVGMYYYFLDDDSDANSAVNKVDHDYEQSLSGGAALLKAADMDCSKPREERPLVSTCYVEGMGGPATEIYFTDDFLNELVALEKTEQGEFSRMGINQCLFSIYINGADYDWMVTQGNAVALTPALNSAINRLGTYLNYNTLSPVIDYDYVYENQYNKEVIYNGYLDRSRGCYTLNITAHIQKLFNSIRQDDGTYDTSKVDEALRVIYIGTEANSPYTFSKSVLQGMDSGENVAPIQIDLTYTLVK